MSVDTPTRDARQALFDPEQSLPARVRAQVALRGSHPAIATGAWQPTYAELDAVANRLAHELIAAGMMPGDRAGDSDAARRAADRRDAGGVEGGRHRRRAQPYRSAWPVARSLRGNGAVVDRDGCRQRPARGAGMGTGRRRRDVIRPADLEWARARSCDRSIAVRDGRADLHLGLVRTSQGGHADPPFRAAQCAPPYGHAAAASRRSDRAARLAQRRAGYGDGLERARQRRHPVPASDHGAGRRRPGVVAQRASRHDLRLGLVRASAFHADARRWGELPDGPAGADHIGMGDRGRLPDLSAILRAGLRVHPRPRFFGNRQCHPPAPGSRRCRGRRASVHRSAIRGHAGADRERGGPRGRAPARPAR